MLLRSIRLPLSSVRRFISTVKEPDLVVGNVDAVTAESLIPKLAQEPFISRHLGPDEQERTRMLASLGFTSREQFMQAVLPSALKQAKSISLPQPISEPELVKNFKTLGEMNQEFRSYIGQGYYGTITPSVIQRNILENPAWYTSYTPYQPEISQGRLEGLFNFQTMVGDLTGLSVVNASLLDEASAAAEAMTLLFAACGRKKKVFLVASGVFGSTISCLKLRAQGLDIDVIIDPKTSYNPEEVFGVLVQSPDKDGCVKLDDLVGWAKHNKIPIACATDPMALVLLRSPKDLGFSVAFGSTQRFGIPVAFGGPHAAFFACKDEYRRLVPGRIVGLSKDSRGLPAFRLALQTREQHIRRDKATSNICTSQALLANMSAMYAVYHGPEGLKSIAKRINTATLFLADVGQRLGLRLKNRNFFDTLVFELNSPVSEEYHKRANARGINLRKINSLSFGISMDETVVENDLRDLMEVLAGNAEGSEEGSVMCAIMDMEPENNQLGIPEDMLRSGPILSQPVFNENHSEAQLTRYIHRLASKDISLVHSMIPLGSCTMKLNGTAELQALSMTSFMNIHPLAPPNQTMGYEKMLGELKEHLGQITGFPHVCLQPNSGAQGELLALSMIKNELGKEEQKVRDICIVPVSAHGTNASSAALAGFTVVPVKCTRQGKLDLHDLKSIINSKKDRIGAMIVTYPSTFGTFDDTILKACQMVKEVGGFVYLDGANMNAMVGYVRPADIGVDVCHLNLHKTFCIPHGGGGPGAGPIAVSDALVDYFPSQAPTTLKTGNISGAFHGSASILSISWAYIKLLGLEGLRDSTYQALLSANYMMKRLAPFYPVRFVGDTGLCAHEFIIDLRHFEAAAGIQAIDVAKRLQDYGFHAPTMSWPVQNTLMIEPTESEGLAELDRYIEALVMIREEIKEIEEGRVGRDMNLLKMAPHTMADVGSTEWNRPYSRERAAFPTAHQKSLKIWPSVNRLDDLYGDQNLTCTSCGT